MCRLLLLLTFLLAPPVLAQTCDHAPLVGPGEFTCSDESELIPCRCSEYIEWDESPDARRYEIWRWVNSEGAATRVQVGEIAPIWHAGPGGVWRHRRRDARWYFAWDWMNGAGMPVAYTRYKYAVKICSSTACGDLSSSVRYVAAPYYVCWYEGDEFLCQSN